MDLPVFEGEVYERQDFSNGQSIGGEPYFRGEFYTCTFRDCDFNAADLSGVSFSDCTFEGCNLSVAKLDGTRLQDVYFKNCKLVGVDFSICGDFAFSVKFEQSNLHLASFWSKVMKRTQFIDCELIETNFTESDLSRSTFKDCDLSQAIFASTNLERADFRSARNFAIDPASNRVKKAKFSSTELAGLLYQFDLEIE
ncbi:pentapeptide repeat-containing protein [Bradymonas sediminis]|uniref:Pentapeptide repeat-containing protein n=1 Tax=Bradymonas sediminis TaxID=1548548 RepID=A0A2Z4FGU9_9DELT|nr:pentapeptide repeat-containing protein [Bradymonas sediminis]AWV88183.1 pentapeptide repeat-containing protein [Bradymonas sediminis]TDP77307.1 uncharacterized protein YjbI with pentapeptide repeats [Bradymonas sediminis]